MPILARQTYNKRPVPDQYDGGFFELEHANIQRAIQRPTARRVVANDTVRATDDLMLVDTTAGAVTVTLPPADRLQFLRVTIKRVSGGLHAVTIAGTVDGTTNPTLGSQWAALAVQSDGSQWFTVGTV